MKPEYPDITSKIKEEPKWYDTFGVPRYEDFRPEMIPNRYATATILLRIECRCCGKGFNVQLDDDRYPEFVEQLSGGLYEKIRVINYFGYGEPPFHKCKGDIPSRSMKIIEFWEKKDFEWKRIKKNEITINEEV